MTLKLYAHPLSSYCQKAKTAFYEKGVTVRGSDARRQRAGGGRVRGALADRQVSGADRRRADWCSRRRRSSNISTSNTPDQRG